MVSRESPHPPESKPIVTVERLWTPDDSRHKYTFSISASRSDLFRVLNAVREKAANSTSPNEIEEFLDGKNNQLNFGVYRFYLDAKENKVHALINGGASSPKLNEEYGPRLANLLGISVDL
jgi:hypothetical protein